MKITKENNQLVLRLPLTQKEYDAVDEEIGEAPALVGYSDGKDFSINYRINMSYKGKGDQLGMPIIMLYGEEELKEVCEEMGLDIWTYERCEVCNEVLF